MPIPSLPIEVVGEIVSHLRTPLKSDTSEAVEAGQALSLVCRRWYPIGQELRWKDLRIEFKAIPTLTAHFAVHPQLGRLVSSFTHDYRRDKTGEEHGLEAGKIKGLAKLIEVMVALAELCVVCPRDSDYKGVILAASRLPQLQFIDLRINGVVVWTPELAAVFATGFPSLLIWFVTAYRMQLEDTFSGTVTRTTPLKGLQALLLRWNSKLSTPSPVEAFTSSIDTGILKRCDLSGSPANSTTLQWLSTCPHLTDLALFPFPQTFAEVYSELLSRLSSMSSLEYVKIEPENRSLTVSPCSLSSIIAIPADFCRFELRSTVFADWEAFEQRSLDPDNARSSICGLIEDSSGKRPAMIWQELEGEAKWYRDPGVWKTWEDHDRYWEISTSP